MELFPDGHHVRLRSRVHGKYLHADEDGLGVSLRSLRGSPNAAWQVHVVVREGGSCVLLHGAAYGRYLAATPDAGPPGHLGHRVVQGVYDDREDDAIVWRAVGTGEGNYVFLRHISYRLLRANGRYQVWHNGVSVDEFDNESTMMHWSVEAIPPYPVLPQLPAPTQEVLLPSGGFMGLFRRRTQPIPQDHRTIRYVRADAFGSFNDQGWQTFQFHGRSVFTLRQELSVLVGEAAFFYNIMVCAKAGRYARVTPLITDLPRSDQPMDIVVLTAGSPATNQLRFPNVHAL